MTKGQRGTTPKHGPPSARRAGRSQFQWEYIAARLRNEPGTWIMLTGVSTGMYSKVRNPESRPLPLRSLDGTLEVRLVGTKPVAGERGTSRRGELWLRRIAPGAKPLVDYINEED